MIRVLFVCTGNTCRSPMAEAIARLKSETLENVHFSSAGLAVSVGSAASPHAQFVVGEHGGDLSEHESRQLDEDLLATVDLVLTMTTAHRDVICEHWPARRDDVFTLGEFTGTAKDAEVNDPFGGDLKDYEAAFNQIDRLIDAAIPKLECRLGQETE